jgi:hypothetical protein
MRVRWSGTAGVENAELLGNDCRSRHARHNLPVAPAIAPEEAWQGSRPVAVGGPMGGAAEAPVPYSNSEPSVAFRRGPKTAQLLRRASLLGPANVLQYFFAQNIGIAFTGFGKRDELREDSLFDPVVALSSPQSDAEHFECNA